VFNEPQKDADNVMTPEWMSQDIIEHYKPTGFILEPCRGTGNFYNNLPDLKDWCEITQGRDFFEYNQKVDWIITNPPLVPFLIQSLELANSVVFYLYLDVFFTKARINLVQEFCFGIKKRYILTR